jgi:hypothetical protein
VRGRARLAIKRFAPPHPRPLSSGGERGEEFVGASHPRFRTSSLTPQVSSLLLREHCAVLRRRKSYSCGRTLSNGAASFRIIANAGGAVALFNSMPNREKRRTDADGIVGLTPLSGG